MTKVYLVYAQGCTPSGSVDLNAKKYVAEVFTNRKLAEKCAEYYNQEWHLGFLRNIDFKAERLKYYYVEKIIINHNDFSKLPF